MQRTENITGFLIKIYSAKDADQVIHLLSTKGSRHTLYAKGSRKETSRKAHAIDLLNLVSIKSSKSGRDLEFINEVKLMSSLRSSITSLHGLMTIQTISEIVDKFCLPDHDQPFLFIWLESASKLINNDNNLLLVSALILKLLQGSGALPDLNRDIYSGDLIQPGEARFLNSEAGYTKRGSSAISDRIYKVQQFILNHPFEDTLRIGLSLNEQKELLLVNINWLVYLVESDIKSLQLFLQSL